MKRDSLTLSEDLAPALRSEPELVFFHEIIDSVERGRADPMTEEQAGSDAATITEKNLTTEEATERGIESDGREFPGKTTTPDQTESASQSKSPEPFAPDLQDRITPLDEPTAVWGMSEGDRRFLMIACSIILSLTAIQLVRLGWKTEPVFQVASARPLQIDVNSASWVEWMQLPGIGETTARTIVADREANGNFQTIEDVQRVRGIGPKKLEQMRPFLKLPPQE